MSLDYPDSAAHDAGRRQGNFHLALKTMEELPRYGFVLFIARQSHTGEDVDAANKAYVPFFREAGINAKKFLGMA